MPVDRRPKLTDEHRAFLVRELACYATPKQAADALSERYGITITAQSAEHYDPSKHAAGQSEKWQEMFDGCRRKFLDHVEDSVPEANKAVRVRNLASWSRTLERKASYMAAAELYEHIAKELGNVHTNRREHSGPGGKPFQVQDVSEMTPEQVNDELRAIAQDPAGRALMLGILASDDESPAIQPPTAPKT